MVATALALMAACTDDEIEDDTGSGGSSASAGAAGASTGGTGGSTGGSGGTAGSAGSSGGTAGSAGAAGSAGSPADAGGDASADAWPEGGTGCNYLTQLGAVITPKTVTGAPPSPVGGAITDGFYKLVSVDLYNGATGQSFQRTLRFVGNELKTVERDGTATFDSTTTGTYTVSSTTLTRSLTCPGPGGGSMGFSATATTFTAYESASPGTVALGYELDPTVTPPP